MMHTLLRAERFLGASIYDANFAISISVSFDLEHNQIEELEAFTGSRIHTSHNIPATLACHIDANEQSCNIISLTFSNGTRILPKRELTSDEKQKWFACIFCKARDTHLEYFASDQFRISPSGYAQSCSTTFDPTNPAQ
jgi:hypothetical protein